MSRQFFSFLLQYSQFIYYFYDEFEIGFPSEEEHLLMPFCENEEQPTQTVYGFVPVKVVDRVLARHGGIDEDATLERSKQDGMA